MKHKKIFSINLVFFLLLQAVFCSCSSVISGTMREGGSAGFSVKIELLPRMSSLIRSFQFMVGSGRDELILDAAVIAQSMAAAPGMGEVALSNTGPSALEGRIELAKIGDFLAITGGERRFVTYTENASQGRITISLDRENAPAVIALLSSDAAAYLSALMAPAATGEILTRTQYLFLVASLYGQPIADEIASAKIEAAIDFPGRVTSVQGGVSSGRRVNFEVPLIDILVLDNPLVWEITWQK